VSRARAAIAALCAVLASTAAPAVEPQPAQDYMLECRGCHGPDGANEAGGVPSLRRAARFLALPDGRSYLVRVPGVAGSRLSDARTAALLNWVLRELARDPAAGDFPLFSADEVARARARPLADPGAERKRLVGAAN
jgi:mono/diheme cytochrome c family protein